MKKRRNGSEREGILLFIVNLIARDMSKSPHLIEARARHIPKC
ncbi:MAG: hypothetical protein ACE362_07255 [Phaeodactylibacter xiamenensis]|nr:hypothetical protein [Phaeodactylibacter xiamenensis]MCR9055360.1 hypothetical protein [bacterium]